MVEDKIYTAFLEKENRRLNDKVVELTKMHTVDEHKINDLQKQLDDFTPKQSEAIFNFGSRTFYKGKITKVKAKANEDNKLEFDLVVVIDD